MSVEILIKNGERCRLYNMLPEYGTLEVAKMTRVMRYELIDKLSETQKEQRGIYINGLGQYACTDEKANDSTKMTLPQESLAIFKEFIRRTSASNSVYYLDEPLFTQIEEMTVEV